MIGNLTDLPSELLYKVLSYLRVEDILQAFACCSDFYEQFSTDARLWSFLCYRDYAVRPEFIEHSKRFYKDLLFPNKNLVNCTFRCGSILVETSKTEKGLLGFYYTWAPDEEKKPFFEIKMDSTGAIGSLCCLNSGDLETISEQGSTARWEENHCDSLHGCSIEVYLSSLAPSRHPNNIEKEYHVLKFQCDQGLLYRFKVMGVKGAFSGNMHSF